MYKVIMAPTDGSANEQPSISLATRLAQRFGAELHLVRIENPHLVVESLANPIDSARNGAILTQARLSSLRQLEALGKKIGAIAGIKIVTALENGSVGQTLAEYAAKFSVDLIVMVSHCRGGLSRITLGSVTDYLIRNSEPPVFVVKHSEALWSTPGEAAIRIIVPLDGSQQQFPMLPHVLALADKLGASIGLLHVLTPRTYSQEQIIQPGMPWWEHDMASAEEFLGHVQEYFESGGLTVSRDVVLSKDVAGTILEFTARQRGDLIAIGSSGLGGLPRLAFGSTADEVTRKATASVIVFHPERMQAMSGGGRDASLLKHSAA